MTFLQHLRHGYMPVPVHERIGMKLFLDMTGKTIPDRPMVPLNDELSYTPGTAIIDKRILSEF